MKNLSKGTIKYILLYPVILLAAVIIGFGLIVVAYHIPVDPVSKEESLKRLPNMGWNPVVNDRYEQYISHFDTFEPGVLNDATDMIILSYSFGDPENSAVYQAANMYGYGRYWHGYVIIYRLLFKVITYWDIPLLNGMLQILIVITLCGLVLKETKKACYAAAAASSYLLLMPVALAFSLQYAPVFYLAFLGSIVVLAFPNIRKPKNILIFFFVLGILTAYFDFFTYFLLVWAYPAAWYVVCETENPSEKKVNHTLIVISSAIIWTIGFIMMYPAKWLILYIICGKEAFLAGNIGEGFTLFGELAESFMVNKETYFRFGVLYTNWRHYMYIGYKALILGWCLYGLYRYIRYGWNKLNDSFPLYLILLSAPVWYLVFYAHSSIHHFFTYRDYAASILAFALIICAGSKGAETNPSMKKKAPVLVLLALCVTAGWLISSFAKQNVMHMDGGDNEQYLIKPEDSLEFIFTPEMDNIRKFGLCAAPLENAEGNVVLSIIGENVNYETKIPIDQFNEYPLQANTVNWDLTSGKKYVFKISVEGNSDGAMILLTNEGRMPLGEFSNGTINSVPLGAIEPLGFMIYYADANPRSDKAFLAIMVGAFLMISAGYIRSLIVKAKENAR